MVKSILKYCFILVLFFPPFLNLTLLGNILYFNNDKIPYNLSLQFDSDCFNHYCDYFCYDKNNISVFEEYQTNISLLKSWNKLHRKKLENSLKLKGNLYTWLLIKNNSDFLTINFLHFQLIDKTNHSCLRN